MGRGAAEVNGLVKGDMRGVENKGGGGGEDCGEKGDSKREGWEG